MSPGQRAFVARPEKALLDLVYLQPGGDAPAYLHELRDLAERAGSPKLRRAAARVADLARAEELEYEMV